MLTTTKTEMKDEVTGLTLTSHLCCRSRMTTCSAQEQKEEEERAKELAKEELRRQQEEGWVPMDTLDKSKVDDDEGSRPIKPEAS